MPVLKVQTEPGVWIPVDGTNSVDGGGEVEPPVKTKFLALPGTSGAYADIAGLSLPSVTHRFVWEIRRTSWTDKEQKLTVTKWNDAGPYGWWAAINANGSAHFRFSTLADPRTIVYCEGSAPSSQPPVNEFTELTQAFDGPTRKASLACDGNTYSASPTSMAVSSLYDSSAPFRIGASGAGNYRNLAADIKQLTLYDGSKVVFTLDPSEHQSGNSWTSKSGHKITLSGGAQVTEAT